MMHMPVQIVRTGRKRKSGPRRPDGHLVEIKENVLAIAMAHPERQCVREADRLDQRAGTRLGRMNLNRQISKVQLIAAEKYAHAARKFQDVYGAPSPNAPSINMTAGDKEHRAPFDRAEVHKRLKAYNDAFEKLYKEAGHKSARAVARVAVYDEWIPAGTSIDDLTRGLSVLVKHYGLTVSRKSSNAEIDSE
jgi:hypothetical protein